MDGPKVVFQVFDGVNFTETILIGWIVIAIILIVVLWLTHNMKPVPSKKQVVAEMMVNTVNNLVDSTMGKNHRNFAPYIAALFSFSALGSLISMFGLRPMTADINVTATWALITFAMITFEKFKHNGPLGYLKSFTEPVFVMTPLNLISEVATPLSLALRHFGNIAGGMIITELLYQGLGFVSGLLHLKFSYLSVFQVGIPAVLSVYFDLFSGFMQAFIFIMLTMAYVGDAMGQQDG